MSRNMKEVADVLKTAKSPRAERLAAQKAFLAKRAEIWKDIQDGKFPARYLSANDKAFVGAPRRTAIRCDLESLPIHRHAKWKAAIEAGRRA
jgi:hypothetical protein